RPRPRPFPTGQGAGDRAHSGAKEAEVPMKPIVIATGLVLAAGAAAADGPRLASQVPGIAVLRLADLPAAPAPTGERQYCSHFFIDPPETEAGRATRARGWEVTGEVP